MDKCTEVHSGGQGLVSMQTKPILSHRHVRSGEPVPFHKARWTGLRATAGNGDKPARNAN